MKLRVLERRDFEEVEQLHLEGNDEIAAREALLPVDASTIVGFAWRDATNEELSDPNHRHLVMEADGRCVGWGHAYVTQAPDLTAIGYISAIYVSSSMRKRGIATALLDALIEWLDRQRATRIELTVVARSDAAEIYKRRGFRPFLETLVFDASDARRSVK